MRKACLFMQLPVDFFVMGIKTTFCDSTFRVALLKELRIRSVACHF